MDFDHSQTDALLSTTRAVRKRLDFEREVSDGVLLECLQLAVQAPTGSNRQTWRWMLVRDATKKAALADIYRRAGAEYRAASPAQTDASAQTGRVMDSANYLAQILQDVPVMVIPLISGRLEDSLEDAPDGANLTVAAASLMGSIIPAMWSFQLALRSRGLGSVLTTIHLRHEQEAAELLGIPRHMSQAGLLPVAYTKGTDFKPAERPPVSEITYLDTFMNPIA